MSPFASVASSKGSRTSTRSYLSTSNSRQETIHRDIFTTLKLQKYIAESQARPKYVEKLFIVSEILRGYSVARLLQKKKFIFFPQQSLPCQKKIARWLNLCQLFCCYLDTSPTLCMQICMKFTFRKQCAQAIFNYSHEKAVIKRVLENNNKRSNVINFTTAL